MTKIFNNKKTLIKKAKDSLELNLALIADRGDWHYTYGLIDMAQVLGLLSEDEVHQYKGAADDARKRKNLLFDRVMQELKCLAEDNPPETANYWIEEKRINVFGYIEDNGNDDRWIVLMLEQYDETGDMVKSEEFATDDVNERELAEQMENLIQAYKESRKRGETS